MTTEAEFNQLLENAARAGDVLEVERLLPLSDPKANDSSALRWAAQNGHLDVVKLLLPVSAPKVNDSLAASLHSERRKHHINPAFRAECC